MIDCKYLFLGHHKCSSSYVKAIFHDVAIYLNSPIIETNNSDNLVEFENEKLDFFLLLNSNKSLVQDNFIDLKSTKCIHVIRDPRDIIISGYYSHLNSHPTDIWPELIPHRANLKTLDITSGIKAEMDFAQIWLEDINSWDFVNSSNMLTVKMEDFTVDAFTKWLEIFKFMEIIDTGNFLSKSLRKLTKRLLNETLNRYSGKFGLGNNKRLMKSEALEIIYNNRFESKTNGRKPGEENIMHHYRKGVPGDWKNHFNTELKDYFKLKYNHILLKYNYENDINW